MIGGLFILGATALIVYLAIWVHRVEKKGADPDAIHKGIFGVKDDPLPTPPRKKSAAWVHDEVNLNEEPKDRPTMDSKK